MLLALCITVYYFSNINQLFRSLKGQTDSSTTQTPWEVITFSSYEFLSPKYDISFSSLSLMKKHHQQRQWSKNCMGFQEGEHLSKHTIWLMIVCMDKEACNIQKQ